VCRCSVTFSLISASSSALLPCSLLVERPGHAIQLLCAVDQVLWHVGFAAVLRLAQEHRISAVDVSQDPGRFEGQKGSAAGNLQVQDLALLIQVEMPVIGR
jgi:hypothetical protein